MSKILYRERKERWQDKAIGNEFVTHYVEVEVRAWTCQGMTPDVVIETRVLVDRELIIDVREVFAHSAADAHFIRKGIERFDARVAQHMPPEED